MVAEKLKRGEENGITARDLCKLLDISDTRKLRLLVAQERSEGIPILSSCRSGGYFLPAAGAVASLKYGVLLKHLKLMPDTHKTLQKQRQTH